MKKRIIFTRRRGFTLVELLMYFAMFVILITAITIFSVTSIKTIRKNQIKKEVVSAAYSAMRTMLYEIRAATNVYNPTSNFDINPGQLSLQTIQNLPIGESLTYIDFYVDSNSNLYLKRENSNPQNLISDKLKVSNLEFKYLASSTESIKINLTIEYDSSSPEYQYSYDLTSSANIRKQ